MTHLQSLIAKAKAAQSMAPGPWRSFISDGCVGVRAVADSWSPCVALTGCRCGSVLHSETNEQALAVYFASLSPHLILALCELAMAAEEVDQFSTIEAGDRVTSLKAGALMDSGALSRLRAKIAAVRGAGS